MRLSPLITAISFLAAVPMLHAGRLGAQKSPSLEHGDFSAEAPATTSSGPTWLLRSPDLRSTRVTIASGVPRDDTVAVHVTEGDVVLDGEFGAGVLSAWADSALAILRATSEQEPPSGVASTPLVIGRAGISIRLEIVGAGARRRFGLVVMDSLREHVIAPELRVEAAHLLVMRLRALGEFARGNRDLELILYALGAPYFEFQLEKPAVAVEGNPAPRYPAHMLAQRVSGEVLLQFVVDTTGRADMDTFKVLKATHPSFIRAVLDVLPKYRFLPAETDGRKVKMYVQMPFEFDAGRLRATPGAPGPWETPSSRWP